MEKREQPNIQGTPIIKRYPLGAFFCLNWFFYRAFRSWICYLAWCRSREARMSSLASLMHLREETWKIKICNTWSEARDGREQRGVCDLVLLCIPPQFSDGWVSPKFRRKASMPVGCTSRAVAVVSGRPWRVSPHLLLAGSQGNVLEENKGAVVARAWATVARA
jgi:hypothetical protein